MTSLKPSIFATPSPISRTEPTLERVVSAFSPEMVVSSSCRIVLMFDRLKLFLKLLEPVLDGSVPHIISDSYPQAAQEFRISPKLGCQILSVTRTQIGQNLICKRFVQ